MSTITALMAELEARVKTTTTFASRGFTIFNIDDFAHLQAGGAMLPMAGIAYEGSTPKELDNSRNRASGGSQRVTTMEARFSVIIAMEYRAVSNHDSKVTAMDLLHEIRDVLQGYTGVNNRPWAFVSEQPIDGDVEGVIFYGQLWMTDIFTTGNYVEP